MVKVGFDVCFFGDLECLLGYLEFLEVGLWLVMLEDEVDYLVLFDYLLENIEVLVLFGFDLVFKFGGIDYFCWEW